jgi:hypothetical protein
LRIDLNVSDFEFFASTGDSHRLALRPAITTWLPLGKPETLAFPITVGRTNHLLIVVSVMELRRNQHNHFAEVEQSAFLPANIVSVIGFSPDKIPRFGVKDRSMSIRCWHKHYRSQPG